MREDGYYWVKEYYKAEWGIMEWYQGCFFAIQCEQAIEEVYQVKEKKIIFEEIKKQLSYNTP